MLLLLIVVSSNPCVLSSPRIKITFPLFSICRDEFISAPKLITFFPLLPFVNKNSERESNPMSYLYGSAFLVNFTDPNKQLPNVNSMSKFLIADLVYKKYTDLLLF